MQDNILFCCHDSSKGEHFSTLGGAEVDLVVMAMDRVCSTVMCNGLPQTT